MGVFNHINWEPKFSVHVEEIDAQHRQLFAIANEIMDIYEKDSADCYRIIEGLVEYVSVHFLTEQKVMMKTNYPDIKNHLQQHDIFTEKIVEILRIYKEKERKVSLDIVTFLTDWIYEHTISMDLKYAEHLLKRGYKKIY